MFGKTEENKVEFEALENKDRTDIKVAATVPDSLNYMATVVGRFYDVVFQKEATNQDAKADVVIDGKILISQAPATFLLGMETKLKDLRKVLEEIPTRTPAVEWVEDINAGKYLYKSKDSSKDVKTAKSQDHKMLPQPNTNIAVTYAVIENVKNIGSYDKSVFSGLISSADKAILIERLDDLLKAIKQARQRANAVEAKTGTVSKEVMGYLFGNWYDPEKANNAGRV
jgi:hypothetical protein